MRTRAAELALEIYRRTLAEVRGDVLIKNHLRREGRTLRIDDVPMNLDAFERVWIGGAGKASVAMAQGVAEVLGDALHEGLVVTKIGHGEPVERVQILEADHPIPGQSSLDAGIAMLEFAERVGERDLVIFLLSGGASALLEAPVEGVTLADLQAVNKALLASGAPIATINAVRSRLSRIKAGGLAQAFSKTTVIVLVLSDVEGNHLNVIGSGPFVPPTDIFDERMLRHIEMAPPIVEAIRRPRDLSADATMPLHRIVGDVHTLGETAVRQAEELGLHVTGPIPFDGEAREVLDRWWLIPSRPLDCVIATGESTVTLRGQGLGGRAQEMAVVAAQRIAGMPDIVVLAAGSDGTDGPTDAAGAFVDGETLEKAQKEGIEAEAILRENDSYRFHEAAGSLLKTGPTGSNLTDLFIAVKA